jgi:hypothetical protein
MKLGLRLALAFVLTSAAACSSDPAPSGPPPTPSEDVLCHLVPHHSNVDDAIALLGQPTGRTTLADGTTTLSYQYSTAAGSLSLANLVLEFNAAHVFVFDSANNLPQPSCWAFDGGM